MAVRVQPGWASVARSVVAVVGFVVTLLLTAALSASYAAATRNGPGGSKLRDGAEFALLIPFAVLCAAVVAALVASAARRLTGRWFVGGLAVAVVGTAVALALMKRAGTQMTDCYSAALAAGVSLEAAEGSCYDTTHANNALLGLLAAPAVATGLFVIAKLHQRRPA